MGDDKYSEDLSGEHSSEYRRLSEEDKVTAETILSYLNGFNNKRAEDILYAIRSELSYCSTINS